MPFPWWQTAVFYQIYPRSFADGNGDGIGDLAGIIGKLDYLRDLGIDAIWLSPHYPSPLVDCGYDIADYTAVAPEYGTLADFRRFLDEAHRRDLRVILDLVLNHTSDQHPWFLESRSSRHAPKRDWYIWRDGRDGEPPNNWASTFGGSAWEYDPVTGQYYYHFFFKEQPDLNWHNPEVRQAMWQVVRFWLDLGVDGFRLDAIGTVFEAPGWPDHTAPRGLAELFRASRLAQTEEEKAQVTKDWTELFRHQVDQYAPMHTLLRELRAVVDEYDDRVLVGETEEIAYLGDGTDELHLVFNFPLMRTERLTPAWIRANQAARLAALPPDGWPCNTLGNHDSPRLYSNYGDGQHAAERARLLLALMLTLRGTPFLYNGEEIGMTDYHLTDLAQFRDTLGIWAYRLDVELFNTPPDEALQAAARYTRDKNRTPMQWQNAPHGGFCPPEIEPWLPVNPNYAQGVNVADQEADPTSLLHDYRRLLHLRRATPALVTGDYTPLAREADDYLAFLRHDAESNQTCLVVLNFSEQAHTVTLDLPAPIVRTLFSSRERPAVEDLARLTVAPFEVYIGEFGRPAPR